MEPSGRKRNVRPVRTSPAESFKVAGGRRLLLAPNAANSNSADWTCSRYLPGGISWKPNTPLLSLKVSASSGGSSKVYKVTSARRTGFPVASFKTTPLMAAKPAGPGGAWHQARARQTTTGIAQAMRMCFIGLYKFAAGSVLRFPGHGDEFARFESQFAIEHHFEGRAFGQNHFGPARGKHGHDAGGRAGDGSNARAHSRMAGDAACDSSHGRAGAGRFANLSCVARAVGISHDLAFLPVHVLDAGIIEARTEIARHPVGQRQGVEADVKFRAALHLTGPFYLGHGADDITALGNDDARSI